MVQNSSEWFKVKIVQKGSTVILAFFHGKYALLDVCPQTSATLKIFISKKDIQKDVLKNLQNGSQFRFGNGCQQYILVNYK